MMHLRIVCLSFGLDPDRFWLRQHRARRSSLVMAAMEGVAQSGGHWWTLFETEGAALPGCPVTHKAQREASRGPNLVRPSALSRPACTSFSLGARPVHAEERARQPEPC